MSRNYFLVGFSFLITVCIIFYLFNMHKSTSKTQPKTWNAEIKFSSNHSLYFQLKTKSNDERPSEISELSILNGDESIKLQYTGFDEENKIRIWQFPFQSELHLNQGNKTGYFIKSETGESFPFNAKPSYTGLDNKERSNRFPFKKLDIPSSKIEYELSNRFALTMKSNSENPKFAIGEFYIDSNSNEYRGSILTETGDYRYLAGNRYGNELYLSTFDGVHGYTFNIHINEDGSISGQHYSGSNYSEQFEGVPDSLGALRNPYFITSPGKDASISLKLPEYETGIIKTILTGKGKVTLIQIMGSWCPNCLDESIFFKELSAYENLEIYALAFERSSDRKSSISAIKRVVDYLDLPYPVLFAGKAEKGAVERLLPIKDFISYPTYLLYDKEGGLVEIHAGFSGPATRGYKEFTQKTHHKIQNLLNQKFVQTSNVKK